MIRKFFITTVALLATVFAMAQESDVEWSSRVVQVEDDIYQITYSAKIADGWKMYDLTEYVDGPINTSFTYKSAVGAELIGDIVPSYESEKVYDDIFQMEIGSYKDSVQFTQMFKLTDDPVTISSSVEWMLCNDMGCTPPQEYDFVIEVGDVQEVAQEVVQEVVAEIPEKESSSMWATIIEAILWGFAALLTPCVFPMVPMTVSFFMKSSGSPAKGRFMAMMYGLSIVALYTVPIALIIGITNVMGGDAVTADIFNWIATHWIPNVLFFIVFVFFAASFFGAFEITMPSWLVNKSDEKADKGGLIGLFFMALTLVLVSFSCTGPIVGSVLIKSTSGEFWEPIITMFAFSTAFALPFTVLAFFPSLMKNLPKSGGWLNSVKVVLGFIELALGLKFLSVADQTYHWGLLDREIYLAIWIVIFTLLGLYLLGKLKFAHDSDMKHLSVKRLFLAIATFSFVVYLIPGMFGAPLKGLSGYLPPMHTQDFVMSQGGVVQTSQQTVNKVKYSDFLHLPYGIQGYFDYDDALEYAKSVDKPLLVDITGHGCVNCREMEMKVWSDPEVVSMMKNDFVVVALYTDDKKEVDESDWVTMPNGKVLKTLGRINSYIARTKFGVNSQPHYLIVNGDGKELTSHGYNLNIKEYIRFLNNGLKLYAK